MDSAETVIPRGESIMMGIFTTTICNGKGESKIRWTTKKLKRTDRSPSGSRMLCDHSSKVK